MLVRRPGPVAWCGSRVEATFEQLHLLRTDQGVAVGHEALRVDLVEHLCAAIGGLGIGADLRVDVFGPEVPLLDGGALRFAQALRQLELPASYRRWRIAKPATLRVDQSTYRFAPSSETHLVVHVEFDHPLVVEKTSAWHGDSDDFLHRIASARTFGFRRDIAKLRAAGRALCVDPSTVVVLNDDGTSESHPTGDECARHKLLDLIGDLTLAGGIPCGCIEATRPGHRANHAIVAMALREGVLVRESE